MIARDKECETAQRCDNVGKLVNETIAGDVQALMVVESYQKVKFDQEASITDVRNTLELRSVGGSSIVSNELPMSASTANASIEKSVREMQRISSMVYGTMSNPGSASSTWTAEIMGHVVIRSQSSVSGCEDSV